MTWERRYRYRQSARISLAIPAGIALILAIVASMLMRRLDSATDIHLFNYSTDGARAVLSTFVGSMLTFIVFVLSATLIVVQLASGQFSPRVIAIVFARPGIKFTLGMLTFTFTFSLAALSRVENRVPDLYVGVAVLLNLICILGFFYFAQDLSQSLRPSALTHHIAVRGRRVIEQVYGTPYDPEKPEQSGVSTADVPFTETIEHTGETGVVMAFSVSTLLQQAKDANVVLQLVPQVGDFIAQGDPLFRCTKGTHPASASVLNACVAIGPERTLDQDPRFIFRVLVDIASKALSPAINDPTTAVIVLDQIHDLLMHIGRRHLGDGLVYDDAGQLRLVFGTPDWPDYVMLAASEIRLFGDTSIQVMRRLRAMLEHLIETLPEARRQPLRSELTLLERTVKRRYPDERDQARAETPDFQGLGGSDSIA